MSDDTKRLVNIGLAVVLGIAGVVLVSLGVTDIQGAAEGYSVVIKLVSGVLVPVAAGYFWLRSRRTPKDEFR